MCAAAAAVVYMREALTQKPTEEFSFVDKHFLKIAFAVATLALVLIAPLDIFLGAAAGFAFHYYTKQPVDPAEPIITSSHTLFTLVGAIAALIRLMPGGAAGGLIFLAIPSLGSLAVGATLYRAFPSPPKPHED